MQTLLIMIVIKTGILGNKFEAYYIIVSLLIISQVILTIFHCDSKSCYNASNAVTPIPSTSLSKVLAVKLFMRGSLPSCSLMKSWSLLECMMSHIRCFLLDVLIKLVALDSFEFATAPL